MAGSLSTAAPLTGTTAVLVALDTLWLGATTPLALSGVLADGTALPRRGERGYEQTGFSRGRIGLNQAPG
jgi:hypothetical protein